MKTLTNNNLCWFGSIRLRPSICHFRRTMSLLGHRCRHFARHFARPKSFQPNTVCRMNTRRTEQKIPTTVEKYFQRQVTSSIKRYVVLRRSDQSYCSEGFYVMILTSIRAGISSVLHLAFFCITSSTNPQ